MDDKLRQQAIELYDHFTHDRMERRDFFAAMTRLAGGAANIEAAAGAPYRPLATIDDVYPDRPDRGA